MCLPGLLHICKCISHRHSSTDVEEDTDHHDVCEQLLGTSTGDDRTDDDQDGKEWRFSPADQVFPPLKCSLSLPPSLYPFFIPPPAPAPFSLSPSLRIPSCFVYLSISVSLLASSRCKHWCIQLGSFSRGIEACNGKIWPSLKGHRTLVCTRLSVSVRDHACTYARYTQTHTHSAVHGGRRDACGAHHSYDGGGESARSQINTQQIKTCEVLYEGFYGAYLIFIPSVARRWQVLCAFPPSAVHFFEWCVLLLFVLDEVQRVICLLQPRTWAFDFWVRA